MIFEKPVFDKRSGRNWVYFANYEYADDKEIIAQAKEQGVKIQEKVIRKGFENCTTDNAETFTAEEKQNETQVASVSRKNVKKEN